MVSRMRGGCVRYWVDAQSLKPFPLSALSPLSTEGASKAFLTLLASLTVRRVVPPSHCATIWPLWRWGCSPPLGLPGWSLESRTPGRHGLLASFQNSFSLAHLPKPDRDEWPGLRGLDSTCSWHLWLIDHSSPIWRMHGCSRQGPPET